MKIAEDKNLRIERLTLGEYETNTYLLTCRQTGESLIIDAPAVSDEILNLVKGTKPKYILLTHDHIDHIEGMGWLRDKLKIPLATHELNSYQLNKRPDILLKGGDIINLGKLKINVLFTSGHTPGGLCFNVGRYLFAGDTIFPGGPGHTETPEDFETILESITETIFKLPSETVILPGHGESTTIEKSKAEYAVFAAGNHEGIYGDVTWQS